MKNIKVLFLYILIITLVQSCGFKPIYSSSNLDLKLEKITFKSSKINNQISRSLRSSSNPDGLKSYEVNFKTKKEKRIVSKNSKGDTESFELKIILDMGVELKEETYTKNFIKKIIYNNNDNKYELKQYEIEIEKQIITDLIEEVLIFFSEI